jgi:hypothetical protein
MQDGTGGFFPVGLNSLRLNLPCYFSVKPGVLAACISPHQYLLGPAISPLLCIQQALRPKDSSPTCIGDGILHPFHQHASWRTRPLISPWGTDKLKNGMLLPATTRVASQIIKSPTWVQSTAISTPLSPWVKRLNNADFHEGKSINILG